MTNVHINNVGSAVETLIPHVFQNHGSGEHPSCICHQVFEYSVFFGGQFNPLAGPLHLLGKAVQFQVPNSEHTRSGNRSTAQQSLDSHQQFGKRERLREVVVSASLEVLGLVANR